ncbi:hypothetical protein M3197_01570 [Sporosarcina aquimarina]|uniref:hypothetical protein n=1 Tax=Sporosarcina aquimarina TaxID=114975 RepID=UPI002040E643|nr:hypothetical protein [Sporosarcina aquimarina]MCM3756164.1 hypothetical protein [Sporosarcina aquimarina]
MALRTLKTVDEVIGEMHNYLDKTYRTLNWKGITHVTILKKRLKQEAAERKVLAGSTETWAKIMIGTLLPYGVSHFRTHVNNDPCIELLDEHGVCVQFGSDGFYDSWSSYGRGDVQEKVTRFGELSRKIEEKSSHQLLRFATNGVTPLNAHACGC